MPKVRNTDHNLSFAPNPSLKHSICYLLFLPSFIVVSEEVFVLEHFNLPYNPVSSRRN